MKAKEEALQVSEGALFRTFHRKDSKFNLNFHFHQEIEVALIVKGQGARFIGVQTEDYQAYELLITPPSVPHTWVSNAKCQENEAWVLHISFANQSFWKLNDLSNLKQWLHQDHARLARGKENFEKFKTLEKMFNHLHQSEYEDRLIHFLKLLNSIKDFKWKKITSNVVLPSGSNQRDQLWMERIDLWIKEHEGISVPDLAKELNTSESTLRRFVKHHTGQSLIDLLNDWRVRQARIQLLQSNLSITEIAFKVGFKNVSHFNREFKKQTGCSPRDWQKNNLLK